MVKAYVESRKGNDGAIFVTERHPHRMSKAQMRDIIKQTYIQTRAGIKKGIHPY